MTRNLTAQTATVTVTQALLAGRQVDNIYIVNVNQSFSVSVMPIDRVTKLRLGQIQWGTWRWFANVSMYSLPNFNRQGSLFKYTSSRTNVNLVAGTVTVTNLAINDTGMYVLNIHLTSSNNEHNIMLTSSGILVTENKRMFSTLKRQSLVICIFFR